MYKAVWNGEVLAESVRTIVVEGNHYFPPDSVNREYFQESKKHTTCPWKGQASYYNIVVNGAVNKDAAWYYPAPKEAAKQIKDYVAFWHGVKVQEVDHIPAITTSQMMEVDRLMVEEYGIGLVQMMENAGRSLAELTRRLMGGNISGRRIAVLCGSGNNGGGGMVAARHLHNWGAKVAVKAVFNPEKLKNVPAHQWDILRKMGVSELTTERLDQFEIILDAIIGYGLSGNPHGLAAEWIKFANHSKIPILSLDAPSGLDTTSGVPGDPCISAAATMTLALPKVGLLEPATKPSIGDLYLADISVPLGLYQRMGISVPHVFDQDSIIRIK